MPTDLQCMAMFVAAITMDDALAAEFKTGSAAVAMSNFNARFPKFALSVNAQNELSKDTARVRLFEIDSDIVQATNTVAF